MTWEVIKVKADISHDYRQGQHFLTLRQREQMRNSLIIIMTGSIVCQFMAAFMAVRLISLSGAFVAWIFLACGFIVQAIRRMVSLSHVLTGQSEGDMHIEAMGLLISVLMLCGIWKFGPLFSEIKRAQQMMADKQDGLQENDAEGERAAVPCRCRLQL